MGEKLRERDRVQIALPIRVRGMSAESKFFDETTETILVSRHGLMTRIRNVVELETEVHVVSVKNDVAGTFMVVWIDRHGRDGFHNLGLQLIESEGDMWNVHFPDTRNPEAEEASTPAWLECARCHQKKLGLVPVTDLEYLGKGVSVARPCDKCKATTAWEFTVEEKEAAPAPAETPVAAVKKKSNQRSRSRVPLKFPIKVMRQVEGNRMVDLTETIDISRTGVYFRSSQDYSVGEMVAIIMPYKREETAIPISARVIRQHRLKDSFQNGVALAMREPQKST